MLESIQRGTAHCATMLAALLLTICAAACSRATLPGTPDIAPDAPQTGQLPLPGDLLRTAAAPNPQLLTLPGSQTDPAVTPRRAEALPSGALRLSPRYNAKTRETTGIAYALYRFQLAGHTGNKWVDLDWSWDSAPAGQYLAIADFTRNRWRFKQGNQHSFRYTLTDDEYAAALVPGTNEMLVLVMAVDNGDWVLEELAFAPSNEPVPITAVTGTPGWSGERVTLRAAFNAAAARSFSTEWNFSGGVVDLVAHADSATVTLTDPGFYPCTVYLHGPGWTTSFDFELEVKPLVAPRITTVRRYSAGGFTGSGGGWITGWEDGLEAVNAAGPANQWAWQLGTAATPATSVAEHPAVIWGTPGTYQCSVTLTNSAGSDTFSFLVEVLSIPPPQILAAGPVPPVVWAGIETTFGATLSGAAPATGWSWDFGGGCDPEFSIAAAPVVVPVAAGTYNCSVTAFNTSGADSFDFSLVVRALTAPVIGSLWPAAGATGSTASFTPYLLGESSPATSWSWNFGGACTPATSTLQSPEVELTGAPGDYWCSLTVSNAAGSDTMQFNFTIVAPQAQ